MAPTHWTYDGVQDEADDLSQGDFLWPTAELREVLSKVHPHFCNDKYVGFIVATQTCDLTRRQGECSTHYVSIASVRALYAVLPTLFSTIDEARVVDGVFLLSKKPKARELLERLVDQNEQALGLFYLHSDSELGIGDPCVVYLRVTVALKAEHYAILQRARKGRLKPEFQAKFGWLLGNLYARPATTDWAEQPDGEKARWELLDRTMKSTSIRWVDDKSVEMLASEEPNYRSLPADDLVTRARTKRPPRLIDEVVTAITATASERVASTLEARLKTFSHHAAKLLDPRVPGADGGPQVPTDPNGERIHAAVVHLARQHLCQSLGEKELGQLEIALKGQARMKQMLK